MALFLRVPKVEGRSGFGRKLNEGEGVSRGGVVVDHVVACPGIGSGQAADTLVGIVGGDGRYHAVRVGADRVQFARTFRPTWATVLGFCLLPVALVGIVFFFVKTTETCTAVVEADHRGTRIRLTGRLDAAVLEQLQTSFDDPAAAARDAEAFGAVGAPVSSPQSSPVSLQSAPSALLTAAPSPTAPPSGDPIHLPPPSGDPVVMQPQVAAPAAWLSRPEPSPTPSPSGDPAPAMSVPAAPGPPFPAAASYPAAPVAAPAAKQGGWVPVWEREDVEVAPSSASAAPLGSDPSSTIVVPNRHAAGRSGLSAVLDDGTELDLSTIVLLGRDPAPGPFEDQASLVPVVDPERSVSKTHIKVELIGGVVMATDRGSTNGSALVGPDGAIGELTPGVPTEVPSGSFVRFGSRSVRVLSSTAQGGWL